MASLHCQRSVVQVKDIVPIDPEGCLRSVQDSPKIGALFPSTLNLSGKLFLVGRRYQQSGLHQMDFQVGNGADALFHHLCPE